MLLLMLWACAAVSAAVNEATGDAATPVENAESFSQRELVRRVEWPDLRLQSPGGLAN